ICIFTRDHIPANQRNTHWKYHRYKIFDHLFKKKLVIPCHSIISHCSKQSQQDREKHEGHANPDNEVSFQFYKLGFYNCHHFTHSFSYKDRPPEEEKQPQLAPKL